MFFQAKILEGVVLERQHPRTTGDPSERRAEVTASRFGDLVVNINISYVPQNGHPKIDQKACGFFVGYSE